MGTAVASAVVTAVGTAVAMAFCCDHADFCWWEFNFLVIRCSIFFEYSEFVQTLLILIGGVTAIYAGFTAVFQFDVKKIIAYSTCSQLGYMFFTLGLSNYSLAMFHL